MDDPRRALLHAARNALNGLVLQLEVASLAAARGDTAMLQRSIDGARGAAADLAERLEGLAIPGDEDPSADAGGAVPFGPPTARSEEVGE